VPVEVLIGVLLFGAIVNVALLLWLVRAENVKFHWSRHLQTPAGSARAHPTGINDPSLRRRPLFVASSATVGEAVTPPSIPYSPVPTPSAPRAPLAETLPPNLAELLSRPASVAPYEDGFGSAPPGNRTDLGSRPVGPGNEVASMAPDRLSVPSVSESSGLGPDPLTGLDGAASWSRTIAIENARLLRYRRPATVVLAEVEGMRLLEERLGSEPVHRLLPVIADAFRREARSADRIARIGYSRFAVFLAETDEIRAINYVDRIQLVCEPWLAASAVPLRLGVGWSSPTPASDLNFALQRAEERLKADLRMADKAIEPPGLAPVGVMSPPPPRAGSVDSAASQDTGVPPAGTGRSGEWTRPAKPSEDATRSQSVDVSDLRDRRWSPGTVHGFGSRTEA